MTDRGFASLLIDGMKAAKKDNPVRRQSGGKVLNPDGGGRHSDGDAASHEPPTRGPEARTDEQLLLDYRNGDRRSFEQLIARHQRELYHFLVRFLGNRASAEDIFQETFLQVHQSAGQFDIQRRFRPWLFTIAANKARDLIRSTSRRPTVPLQAMIRHDDGQSGQFVDLMAAVGPSPTEPIEKAEMQSRVQRIVLQMPEHFREILLLSYFHQFPYKQIGEILGIPLGTVKSRLHSAVGHFAQRWAAANPGEIAS